MGQESLPVQVHCPETQRQPVPGRLPSVLQLPHGLFVFLDIDPARHFP